MAFSKEEKQALLTIKGVGETVIKRLENIGIDSFAKLSHSNVEEIADIVVVQCSLR
ncbi:MAG: helix-hairpin-helix domain-containing protein [Sulfurovum sp.]|nr:helix-hairpin-helix domain-containing protein [Sulfurovum sp.]